MLESSQPREDAVPIRAVTFNVNPQPGGTNLLSGQGMLILPGYTRLKEYLLTNNTGSRSRWKDCQHYKCSQVPGSGVASVNGTVDYNDLTLLHQFKIDDEPDALYKGEFGTCGEFNLGLTPYYTLQPDGSFVPPPDGLDGLLGAALGSILPQVKAELSVLNTIIEFKDMVTLRSTIENAGKTFKKFSSLAHLPLSQLFRTKADIYLQYKFNIAPLISDIVGIYRAVANHEKRINDLIARSGRVRISHWSKNLTESNEPGSPVTVANFPMAIDGSGEYIVYTSVTSERFVQADPASFHVQVQYNYNYTAYQLEHARVLALLDSLGVNFNPQIIWNALPWSFVVDWVLGVGRYLDQFGRLNMAPMLNILQCLWSVRRSRRIIVQGFTSSGNYYGGLPNVQSRSHFVRPVVVETAYRRTLFTPSISSITSSGLTPTEISLGAALIISRRRRPKRLRR